jgi:nucleoside phosphorylase
MAPELKKVAILFAMEQEAAPTIARLGLKPLGAFAPPLACLAFEGAHAGLAVTVVVNGTDAVFKTANVGTVAAALTAHAVCDRLKPDLLISAGTAGGFKARGGAIGDVYVTSESVNHDRRCGAPRRAPGRGATQGRLGKGGASWQARGTTRASATQRARRAAAGRPSSGLDRPVGARALD